MEWVLKNYIGTKKKIKIFYKKSKEVLLAIILGNIKKKKLNLKELAKGN